MVHIKKKKKNLFKKESKQISQRLRDVCNTYTDKVVLFRMSTFKTPQISDKERNNSVKKQGKYLNRNFKKKRCPKWLF